MISDNIISRKMFEEIKELIESLDGTDRFYELLRDWLLEKMPIVQPITNFKPMEESEAINFSHTLMPFGDNKGVAIRDINQSYLVWLSNQTFHRDLQRYVASYFFQRQL